MNTYLRRLEEEPAQQYMKKTTPQWLKSRNDGIPKPHLCQNKKSMCLWKQSRNHTGLSIQGTRIN